MLQTQVLFQIIAPKTFEDLITEIESWDFYVDREIPMIDALEAIKSEIEAIQLTIDALNEEIHPEDNKDEVDEAEIGNKRFNFLSLLYIYQRILKIDKIKPKETTLMEFAVLEKQVEEVKKLANKNKQVE